MFNFKKFIFMKNLLFNPETGKFENGFTATVVYEIGSSVFHLSPMGCVIFTKGGIYVDQTTDVIWNGPIEVTIVKDNKPCAIKVKAVHWNESYHEDFKFLEPVDGGIVVVKRDNMFVAELSYQYEHHKDYHLVCSNDKGKQAVFNCHLLEDNPGDTDAALKFPFQYSYVKLGSRTFGLQVTKRNAMVYCDRNKKSLYDRIWGAANSLEEALDESNEIGDILRIVPSVEYPGLFGLFCNTTKKIVVDGKKEFVNKKHYFLGIDQDNADGSKGKVTAYNKQTFEELP